MGPIWLNVSITVNQLKYLITGLSFTDIMPPYFKDKFFESIQMIFVWKYKTKKFIPYLLGMAVLYIKCWFCLRSDYIINNLLSYLYPLPPKRRIDLNSTVRAGRSSDLTFVHNHFIFSSSYNMMKYDLFFTGIMKDKV